MLRTCTIKLHTDINNNYSYISIDDMLRTVVFNSGIVEIDFCLAFFQARSHFHAINFHDSVDKFVEDNQEFVWIATHYGEHILRRDCSQELV